MQSEKSDDVCWLILQTGIYGGLDTDVPGYQDTIITFELTTIMFRPQTIAVFLSFAAHGLSIGCEYVGLDYFKDKPTGTITTQLDPLVEGQGFDIIDPYKCSFRFHTPQDRTATLENIQNFSDEFRNGK